jgi:hypothetical protein
MVSTTFKYQRGFLVVPYMSSMFHNNGVVTKLDGEPICEFDDGSVCGLNFTHHLVNPLVHLKISFVIESYVTFMVNLNFKYGVTKP